MQSDGQKVTRLKGNEKALPANGKAVNGGAEAVATANATTVDVSVRPGVAGVQ